MNDEELMRYSRQILLHEFDIERQQTLKDACVLIVGAGGLGCPAAMYLASAGVGKIIIVDDDIVELSNLQRQIAHGTDDLGMSKVDSLKAALTALNPHVAVEATCQRLTESLGGELVNSVDLVLDCSDNFPTRFLLNRLCRQYQTAQVIGAAQAMEGQALLLTHQIGTPCYECLFKNTGQNDNQNCATSGVLAPVVGIVGSYQALLAIKQLTGFGQSDAGNLFTFDFYQGRWLSMHLYSDKYCISCLNH